MATIPTAVAPSSLTGAPKYRTFTPVSGFTLSSGFVTGWTPISGSVSGDTQAVQNQGLVVDSVGGPCLCVNHTNSFATNGGLTNTCITDRPMTDTGFTICAVVNAATNPQGGFNGTNKPSLFSFFGRDPSDWNPTGFIDLYINEKRQWCFERTGDFGTSVDVCTGRATVSNQVIIFRADAERVSIGVYTRATGAVTWIGTFGALAPSVAFEMVRLVIAGNELYTAAVGGWAGSVRCFTLVNTPLIALADDLAGQLDGHCEWLLQQALAFGKTAGDTTETKALIYFGDSQHAGCYADGIGTVPGFAAENFSGYAAVQTVAVPGATAATWVSTPDVITDAFNMDELFPGLAITSVTVISKLGVNDAGISGGSITSCTDFWADYRSIPTLVAAACGTPVAFMICTLPPSANWGSGVGSGAQSSKNNGTVGGAGGLRAYSDTIRANWPSSRIIERQLDPAWLLPSTLSSWNDNSLHIATTTPEFALSGVTTTLRTYDSTHMGRIGQEREAAIDAATPSVRSFLGLPPLGGSSRRGSNRRLS